jgi:MFS family permease
MKKVIVGSSTLSYFYPTLVNGLGYTSTVQAQYMTVPIYAVAFVCTAVTTYFADSISKHRGIVISSWLCFSLITSILVCVIYDFKARYALLVLMAAGLWASNAVALSFASATFGSMEPEVRAIALALVNARICSQRTINQSTSWDSVLSPVCWASVLRYTCSCMLLLGGRRDWACGGRVVK